MGGSDDRRELDRLAAAFTVQEIDRTSIRLMTGAGRGRIPVAGLERDSSRKTNNLTAPPSFGRAERRYRSEQLPNETVGSEDFR